MNIIHKIRRYFRPSLTCEEINEFILDYVEERLNEETRAQFEEHIKMCPCCVPFLEQYKKTVEMVATDGKIDVPADLAEHTMSFLREQLPSLQQ